MPSASTAAPFIALALVLVTVPHHWRVKNIATLSIIVWLSVYDLTSGINAVIWEGNVDIRAQVWCDIATKLKIGADAGLPGCCLCLARQLNRIAYGYDMSPRGWRYRALDIFFCLGLPLTIMVLHIIVQGHRFDILQDMGCQPAVYVSWPSIIILDLSSFIPAVLALVYCGMALVKLYRRRVTKEPFRIILQQRDTSLTRSRYIRLMIMTFVLGSWNTVLISLSTSREYTEGLQPWTNWTSVHEDFSFITQSTPDDFDPDTLLCLYILWWAVPFSSLAFFIFFGIGEEAMKDYRASVGWVTRVILPIRRDPPATSFVGVTGEHSTGPDVTTTPTKLPTIKRLPPIAWDTE